MVGLAGIGGCRNEMMCYIDQRHTSCLQQVDRVSGIRHRMPPTPKWEAPAYNKAHNLREAAEPDRGVILSFRLAYDIHKLEDAENNRMPTDDVREAQSARDRVKGARGKLPQSLPPDLRKDYANLKALAEALVADLEQFVTAARRRSTEKTISKTMTRSMGSGPR
jgi:hypothetical protein